MKPLPLQRREETYLLYDQYQWLTRLSAAENSRVRAESAVSSNSKTKKKSIMVSDVQRGRGCMAQSLVYTIPRMQVLNHKRFASKWLISLPHPPLKKILCTHLLMVFNLISSISITYQSMSMMHICMMYFFIFLWCLSLILLSFLVKNKEMSILSKFILPNKCIFIC